MKLEEYLNLIQISPRAFAMVSEIDYGVVRLVIQGYTPSLENALKIEKYTYGKVTPTELVTGLKHTPYIRKTIKKKEQMKSLEFNSTLSEVSTEKNAEKTKPVECISNVPENLPLPNLDVQGDLFEQSQNASDSQASNGTESYNAK